MITGVFLQLWQRIGPERGGWSPNCPGADIVRRALDTWWTRPLRILHHRAMRVPVILATVLLAACSSSGKGPVTVSSGDQTPYALGYADELNGATKSFQDAQAQEKTLSGGFGARVDELKKPDWDKVLFVVDESDKAGKSADYAEAHGDADAVKELLGFGEGHHHRRRSSAMPSTASRRPAAAPTSPGRRLLDERRDRQGAQKRMRGKNEGFVAIERYKVSLGPQNVAVLEKLGDDVSQASYDVHVQMSSSASGCAGSSPTRTRRRRRSIAS